MYPTTVYLGGLLDTLDALMCLYSYLFDLYILPAEFSYHILYFLQELSFLITTPLSVGDHQCLRIKDLLMLLTLHILNILPKVRALYSVQNYFLIISARHITENYGCEQSVPLNFVSPVDMIILYIVHMCCCNGIYNICTNHRLIRKTCTR